MGFDFKTTAKKANSMSRLMANREKITTEDIIRNYPDGITLNNFDIIINSENEYPVFTFKENDNVFYNGGTALKKIVDFWVDSFEGDVEKCAKDFAESEGLKVKLNIVKTKSNRNFVTVEII